MTIQSTFVLRKADINDIDTVVNWSEDADFFSILFRGCEPDRSSKVRYLARKLAEMSRAFSTSKLFIVDAGEHKNIGLIYFHGINWFHQNLVIEHHVDKVYQGAPVIDRMLVKAYEFAYFELNMLKVCSYVHGANQRALQFSLHFGEPEVILKHYIYSHEAFHDLYIFSDFREERLRERILQDIYDHELVKLQALGLISREEINLTAKGRLPVKEQTLTTVLARVRERYGLPEGPREFTPQERTLIDTHYAELNSGAR